MHNNRVPEIAAADHEDVQVGVGAKTTHAPKLIVDGIHRRSVDHLPGCAAGPVQDFAPVGGGIHVDKQRPFIAPNCLNRVGCTEAGNAVRIPVHAIEEQNGGIVANHQQAIVGRAP